jgi:predicted ATPase/DNA-binding CsgD family transcriptional regulator
MARAAVPSQLGSRRRPGQPPSECTAFVGRKAELAAIGTLLDSARLVTTVGPPGVGKTRVSLRAAVLAADRYPDGVWLAELSGLREPALVPAAVAACLGLPGQDARARLPAVLDCLRERRLLLILDTCEHLMDACAAFAEGVLREAPGVTLLATSRQPLDVPGEHVYPVPPLPVCDLEELFARRAAAVVPGFAVTAANRADVIRLCERLDGIPLGIELAAGRLRTLPLADLADRVESGFGILTGDRRGASPRHQTLGTAADWSYGLCTPAEQALWARLSVFAGPFDMTAAEQVCADADLPRGAVVEALIGLVDKSVVLRDHAGGPRYRLLGALREFGAAKLAEAGQEAACRGRLIDRYLAMATYFDEHFLDDDQRPGREAGCAAAVREALLAKQELGDTVGIAYAVEALGWLTARAGRPEHAAWLLGAAESLRERTGSRLSDIAALEVPHRHCVRRIRRALGDRRYAAAHAQGAGHPLDLVVRRAVDTAGDLLAAPPAGPPAGPSPALTRRELEIAAMVASGLSNREIAARLFISKRTVDAHVEHIYAKLEVSSRVQLTVWLQDQAPGIGTATATTRNGDSRPGDFAPSLTLEHARQ